MREREKLKAVGEWKRTDEETYDALEICEIMDLSSDACRIYHENLEAAIDDGESVVIVAGAVVRTGGKTAWNVFAECSSELPPKKNRKR